MASQLFGTVDICVFALCSVIPLIIGVVVVMRGEKQSTTIEYLLGGRKQRLLPVVVSFVVSLQSSVSVLGIPAEAYLYGAMYCVFIFGQLLLLPISVKIIAPLFYKLKLTSVNKYFGGRFPTMKVRYLMVCCSVLTNTCFGGLVLVGPAMVLQPMIGVPSWVITIVMSLVAVIYTSLGGIRVVLWTDVFQCLVMISGMVALLVKCTIEAGGPANVIDIATRYKRLDLFDFNPDPTIRHTFWTLNIGRFFLGLTSLLGQTAVQRLNSLSSIKDAKLMPLFFLPSTILFEYLAVACGLAIFAYYQSIGCDPMAAGHISHPNGIIIMAIHYVFRNVPGLTGLFLSAIVAASLSTLSSCLNGLAAIICEDFVRLRWNTISEKNATVVSRLSVIVLGALSVLIALVFQLFRGNLAQLTVTVLGALSGPMAGVFIMSLAYKKTTTIGVYVGAIAGFLIALWLFIGNAFSPTLPETPWLPLGGTDHCVSPVTNTSMTFLNYTAEYKLYNTTTLGPIGNEKRDPEGLDRLYSLSYLYMSPVTMLITVVVGVIVSRLSYLKSGSPVAPDDHVITFRDGWLCPIKPWWQKTEQQHEQEDTINLQTQRMIDA